MPGYPEIIVMEPGSEEYDLLVGHSDLIDTLADIEGGPITLSADIMFQGDEDKWKNFVDIFFAGESGEKYFGFKNDKIYVLPERGGKEGLREMLDFMMVDRPETMMNFAKAQARKQMNAPSEVVARGIGIRTPGRGARNYAAQQAARINNRNNNNVDLWNNINSNNEKEPENNGRPEIRVNNNGEENKNGNNGNNNNNGSNRTVPSKLRPFTLANYIPSRRNRRSTTRRRRTGSTRKNRKASRRNRK